MSVLTISLSESRSKEVTRLLANDTARKIMSCVSSESKSESAIAQELDLALSTVHYNVQKLYDAGILASDEFTYSQKGKEVRHYHLVSEHIVISTKPSFQISELLAGAGLAVVLAAGVAFLNTPSQEVSSAMMRTETADIAMQSAPVAAQPAVWPWVLAGALVAMFGVLIVRWLNR